MRSESTVTVHALTWLALGNAVGLLLATLLLFPELGRVLAPLSYGRWVPLHLDVQLYGWCGLPLVGLLLRLYLPAGGAGTGGRLAVAAWSGALLAGCLSWLAGGSSGKIFLDWAGAPRLLFLAALVLLEGVLALGFLGELRRRRAGEGAAGGRWGLLGKGVLLAALALVPAALAWATRPPVYPPINPDSGGPTGASLLGSTVGVLWIFVACPGFLGLRLRGDEPAGRRVVRRTLAILALHSFAFLLMDHGDHSHHEPVQVLALASLLIWPPLLARYVALFTWPRGSRRWLLALGAWGSLLVGTAVLTFLPGVLERLKFTDALVGHAHLAMAGMVTSFNVLLLLALNDGHPLARVLGDRASFALWQGGSLVLVTGLVLLGGLEGADPGLPFRGGPVVTFFDALRWLAGVAMLAASLRWLAGGLGAVEAGRPAAVPMEGRA